VVVWLVKVAWSVLSRVLCKSGMHDWDDSRATCRYCDALHERYVEQLAREPQEQDEPVEPPAQNEIWRSWNENQRGWDRDN